MPDGKAYRKHTNPYDICDYKWLYDPKLYISHIFGRMEWVKPDPIWKYSRK